MDAVKTWIVEVGWKQMGPSLVKGALTALVGYVAAHHGALALLGLTYDPTQNTLVLDMDAFGKYLLPLGAGVITASFAALQHHTVAAVTGAPQSGDMRKMEPDVLVTGGQRKDDPKT
jgi:hypothetical protein